MQKSKPIPEASPKDAQLRKLLSRTDWSEIQELLEKKSYQRKVQIIEAFTILVTKRGLHRVSHTEIAKECGITRQLVAHHFPNENDLIVLTYKYIYAGWQKFAADGLMAKSGFIGRFEGYVDGVVKWMVEKRSHARFLVQFYAVVQLDPELSEFFERNVLIGQQRLTALLLTGQSEGFFSGLSEPALGVKATSLQVQVFGFLVTHSWKDLEHAKAREELFQACLALIGLPSKNST
jgi:AcrR family transcriptional regulator